MRTGCLASLLALSLLLSDAASAGLIRLKYDGVVTAVCNEPVLLGCKPELSPFAAGSTVTGHATYSTDLVSTGTFGVAGLRYGPAAEIAISFSGSGQALAFDSGFMDVVDGDTGAAIVLGASGVVPLSLGLNANTIGIALFAKDLTAAALNGTQPPTLAELLSLVDSKLYVSGQTCDLFEPGCVFRAFDEWQLEASVVLSAPEPDLGLLTLIGTLSLAGARRRSGS